MTKLMFVCAALLSAGATAAAAQDWSWLEPGKTTRAEVVAKAGEPARAGTVEVVRGLLDPFPPLPDTPHGLRDLALDPCPRITVEVLAWGAPGGTEEPDRLVFLHDRLLYFVVRTTAGERTLPKTESEGRAKYRDVFFEMPAGDAFRRVWVSVREDRNTGFVQFERAHWNVPGPAVLRMDWADPKRFESELAGADWSWPVKPPPRDWSWVRPGKTTRAQVGERAGKPRRTETARLVKGLVDFRYGRHLNADGVPILVDPKDGRFATVELWEYDPGDTLVLLGDRVLYFGVRPGADLRTAAAIEAKFGKDPESREAEVLSECVIERWQLLPFTGDRVAFAGQRLSGGATEFTVRLEWAPPEDFATELGAKSWRLPQGRGWWLPEPAK